MIRLIDGVIQSLTIISRHLKGDNQNAYRWADGNTDILEAERKERALGHRPAIISEDTRALLDDIEASYTGNKGKDYWRGSV